VYDVSQPNYGERFPGTIKIGVSARLLGKKSGSMAVTNAAALSRTHWPIILSLSHSARKWRLAWERHGNPFAWSRVVGDHRLHSQALSMD